MSWPYPFFTKAEMECRGFKRGMCRCGGILPLDEFMNVLVAVRIEASFPFVVTSGARCAEYNAKIGGSVTESAHVTGIAADIQVFGAQAAKLVVAATKHGILGIGLSQRQGTDYKSRFAHLDREQREWVKPGECWLWSY